MVAVIPFILSATIAVVALTGAVCILVILTRGSGSKKICQGSSASSEADCSVGASATDSDDTMDDNRDLEVGCLSTKGENADTGTGNFSEGKKKHSSKEPTQSKESSNSSMAADASKLTLSYIAAVSPPSSSKRSEKSKKVESTEVVKLTPTTNTSFSLASPVSATPPRLMPMSEPVLLTATNNCSGDSGMIPSCVVGMDLISVPTKAASDKNFATLSEAILGYKGDGGAAADENQFVSGSSRQHDTDYDSDCSSAALSIYDDSDCDSSCDRGGYRRVFVAKGLPVVDHRMPQQQHSSDCAESAWAEFQLGVSSEEEQHYARRKSHLTTMTAMTTTITTPMMSKEDLRPARRSVIV